MNEIWRNIDGFENLYQISNLGRVKSLGNGNSNNSKERILKPGNIGNGYLFVHLWKEGKRKKYLVHRLVASAFLENPNNLPQVNHINENKTDNSVKNLEWCSSEYNCNYGSRNERMATIRKKPIYSINKTTNEITYYQSTIDAERITGIYHSSIYNCLKKNRKSAGGYKWHYAS